MNSWKFEEVRQLAVGLPDGSRTMSFRAEIHREPKMGLIRKDAVTIRLTFDPDSNMPMDQLGQLTLYDGDTMFGSPNGWTAMKGHVHTLNKLSDTVSLMLEGEV